MSNQAAMFSSGVSGMIAFAADRISPPSGGCVVFTWLLLVVGSRLGLFLALTCAAGGGDRPIAERCLAPETPVLPSAATRVAEPRRSRKGR